MTDPERYTDNIEPEAVNADQIHADLQEMGATILHGFGAKIDVLRMELEALAGRFKSRDPYAKDLIHRDTSIAIQALKEAASWTRDAASRIPAPNNTAEETPAPQPVTRPTRREPRPVLRRVDFTPSQPPAPQPDPSSSQ